MHDRTRPIWFQTHAFYRCLWIAWSVVLAPFQRHYSCDPSRLHAVIIVRDLYSPLESIILAILAEGVPSRNILLVNSGSSSLACLEKLTRLEEKGCQVLALSPDSYSQGPYAIWLNSSISLPPSFWDYPFLLTDPDLDLNGIPDGWLNTLFQLLNQHRWVSKIGLGLRIDDLSCPDSKSVGQWEECLSQRFPYNLMSKVLVKSVSGRVCPTDTTLALYRPLRHFTTLAIRLEGHYRICHLPWYSSFLKTEEYSYYQQHKDPGIGKWSSS